MQEIFEKIIEKLTKHMKLNNGLEDEDYFAGETSGYKQAMSIVQEVAEEYATDTNVGNNGWIPCSERLPEDGTYLCTLDGELCGLDEPFTGMCGIENGVWDEPDCVIAWQPLPEPYQKGE